MSWTKYYKDDWKKPEDVDDDGPPPAKKARVTTGPSREFETGDRVMVKYPDKWYHGIVTNYFSTTQAKGNKKIKAGYVVDFIETNDWFDGLQPKKGIINGFDRYGLISIKKSWNSTLTTSFGRQARD